MKAAGSVTGAIRFGEIFTQVFAAGHGSASPRYSKFFLTERPKGYKLTAFKQCSLLNGLPDEKTKNI